MSGTDQCEGEIRNGKKMCKLRGVELVDRATLLSSGLELAHPPVGEIFCPKSGVGLSFAMVAEELDDLNEE
jgi:hypothetical protein